VWRRIDRKETPTYLEWVDETLHIPWGMSPRGYHTLNNNNTKRQKKRRRREKNASLRIWASLELVDDGNRTRRRRRKSERERRTCRGTRDFSGPSAAETEEGRKMRKETMARRHRIRKEKERETWSNSISSSAPCFLSINLSLSLLYARTHKRRSHRTRRER